MRAIAIVVLGFAIVTATLLTASTWTQRAIVVSYENSTGTCDIATIGWFHSTYEPTCNSVPGVAFKSSTQTFWPLFPAPNSYGVRSPGGVPAEFSAFGLTGAAFNSCEVYMPESFTNVTKLGVAGFAAMNAEISLLSGGCLNAIPDNLTAPMNFNSTSCGFMNDCDGFSFAYCTNVLAETLSFNANLTAFNGLINGECIPYGATTSTSCAEGWWFWVKLYSASLGIEDVSGTSTSFLNNLTSTCTSGNTDIATFESVQRFMLSAMILAWICSVTTLVHGTNYASRSIRHVFLFLSGVLITTVFLAGLAGLVKVKEMPLVDNAHDCIQGMSCANGSSSVVLAATGLATSFLTLLLLFGKVCCSEPLTWDIEKEEVVQSQPETQLSQV